MKLDKKLNEIEGLYGVKIVEKYSKIQENWLELYWKNITISESFYRKLYIFETFLKNRIDVAFTNEFGENWLILDDARINFKDKEIQKIREVYTKFQNKKLTHNKILENLSFGFWTGIFHSFYNRQIWERYNCNMLKHVFPYLAKNKRVFKSISKDIDKIRKFRNQIFHFSDILDSNYEEISKLLEIYTMGICGDDILLDILP